MAEYNIQVLGMVCGSCKHTIETGLMREYPALERVAIDLDAKSAIIVVPESSVGVISGEILIEEIEDMGFDASLISTKLVPSLAASDNGALTTLSTSNFVTSSLNNLDSSAMRE